MDNSNENNNIKMNDLERLNLKKMIKEGNVEDNTEYIQKLKHSNPIAEDILKIQSFKQSYSGIELNNICIEKCSFLYNNYTDIFNRIVRDELDLKIFSKFLFVLKQIEENKLNFHDASFTIGKLLKEMYVDSAMRHTSNINQNVENVENNEPKYIKPINISWSDYKKKHL